MLIGHICFIRLRLKQMSPVPSTYFINTYFHVTCILREIIQQGTVTVNLQLFKKNIYIYIKQKRDVASSMVVHTVMVQRDIRSLVLDPWDISRSSQCPTTGYHLSKPIIRSIFCVGPMSYFTFQPVPHNWLSKPMLCANLSHAYKRSLAANRKE